MDKGLTVPKWVLVVWPKIPQMPPEFICPICLPKPKSSGFQSKKRLHWASIVRVHNISTRKHEVGLNDPISWCNYDTLVQTQMAHKNESRLVLVLTMYYKRASLGKGKKELSENSIGP
jgi:hypothetical protein